MSSSGHPTPVPRSRSRSPSSQSLHVGSPHGLAPSPLRSGSPVSALRVPVESRRSSLSRVTSREEVVSDSEDGAGEVLAWQVERFSASEDEGMERATPPGPIGREASPRPTLYRNDTSGRTVTTNNRSSSRQREDIRLERRNVSRGSEDEDGGTVMPAARLDHRYPSSSPRGAPPDPTPLRSDRIPPRRSRISQSSHTSGINADDLFEQREREEELRNKDAFYQERSFTVNEPVGSLSISPSNRDICLASRKGLFILDMQYTDQAPRKIPQGGTWQIADCQWSPHPSHSNLILTTSSQKLLVWDLLSTSPSTSLSRIIPACNRAVTDINWHATLPDLMATTGIDGSVKVWDLRKKTEGLGMGQATNRFSEWGSAGTQVKWNRQHQNILASSHDNSVRIWDTRKGSVPVTVIEAHEGRIYGIDWDRRTRHQIVTCSLDKTIKYWSIDELDRANSSKYIKNPYFPSLPAPQEPDSVIQTNNPVWRARNLPFGSGVLSLPQRGESSLEMWGKSQGDGPIERFEEYSAPVKDFVWRTRGGQNPGFEDREFQLITWHKDRQLRATPVPADVLERAGYIKGAKIDVLVSRRNAPNISYASWDHGLTSTMGGEASMPNSAKSESGFFSSVDMRGHRQRTMSVKTTIEAAQTVASAGKVKGPSAASGAMAVMTRGTIGGKSKRSKAVDQLDWIGGITVKRLNKNSASESAASSAEASRVRSRLNRSRSRAGSRDRQPLSMVSAAILNRAVGDVRPPRRASDVTDANDRDESSSMDMADEIRQIKRIYPRVKFKGADLDFRRRKCSVGVNGPWGDNGQFVYVQAFFRFPRATVDGPAVCELANNVQISEDVRQRMQQELEALCQDNKECLLPCIEYLMAPDQRKSRPAALIEEDSGSESDLEQIHQLSARTSGASFGPNGQLICFFPKALLSRKRLASDSRSPTGAADRIGPKSHISLFKAMSALSRMSGPEEGSMALHGPPELLLSDGYSMMMPSGRPHLRLHGGGMNGLIKPSTALQVRDAPMSGLFDVRLAKSYRLSGGLDGCLHNARSAQLIGRDTLSLLWTTLATVFRDEASRTQPMASEHRRYKRSADHRHHEAVIRCTMVRAIFDLLLADRDVQTLAVMVVLIAEEIGTGRGQRGTPVHHPSPSSKPAGAPQDYFQPQRTGTDRRRSSGKPFRQDLVSGVQPSLSPSGRNLTSASGFSQIFPGFSSFRSNMSAIGLRQRQDSDVSLYQPPTEMDSAKPVSAVIRRKDRSASPRKDSFRSQVLSKNIESYSPDLEGVSQLRVNALQSATLSLESDYVGRSPYRQSPRTGTVPLASADGRRHISQLGRYSHVATQGLVDRHIPWSVVSTDRHTAAMTNVPSLLDPSKLAQYQVWRIAYADQLSRAELYQQRAAVLKLDLTMVVAQDDREITVDIRKRQASDRSVAPHHSDSLVITTLCLSCDEISLRSGLQSGHEARVSCIRCAHGNNWPSCIVCRLPVKGLAKSCFTCLHTAHQSCSSGISSGTTLCSAGCGCNCASVGGFSGIFDAAFDAKGLESTYRMDSHYGEPVAGKLSALGIGELDVDPLQAAGAVNDLEEEGFPPSSATIPQPVASTGYRAYAKAQVRRMAGEKLPLWL